MDKQMLTLWVLIQLRQLLGFLLLTPNSGNVAAYKKVTPESLITVQVKEIMPVILNKLINSVCMLRLDVLWSSFTQSHTFDSYSYSHPVLLHVYYVLFSHCTPSFLKFSCGIWVHCHWYHQMTNWIFFPKTSSHYWGITSWAHHWLVKSTVKHCCSSTVTNETWPLPDLILQAVLTTH